MREVLLLIAIAAAGCGKPDIKKLEPYRTEMCACTNVVCANAVFDRWAKVLLKYLDVDAAEHKQIMEISKGVNDCRDKLMMDAALPGLRSK